MAKVEEQEKAASPATCASAEELTRKLKSSALSSCHKLKLAKAAWEAPDFLFPQRKAFLLEWTCGAMLKSVHYKEQSLGDPPFLNTSYWEFLRSLLQEARAGGAEDPSRMSSASAAEPLSAVMFTSLKTPVVPLFTGLASRLAQHSWMSAPNDKVPTCAPDVEHYVPTLLQLSTDCYRLFADSEAGSVVLKSSLEHQAALIPPLTDLVLRLRGAEAVQDDSARARAESAVRATLRLVLVLFESQLVGQGNQKKIFTLVTGKLLAPLLRIRYYVCRTQDAGRECLSAVDAILRISLFHYTIIPDYFSVLTHRDNEQDSSKQPLAKCQKSAARGSVGKLIQSYQRALFDELVKLAREDGEINEFALDAFSFLLSEFVQAARRRGGTGTTHNPAGSAGDNSLMRLEHAFFMELYWIVTGDGQMSAAEKPKKRPHDWPMRNPAVLTWRNKLLRTFQELGICKPEAAQSQVMATPHAFLRSIAVELERYLGTVDAEPEIQSSTLDTCRIIMEIDHTIMAPSLNVLCEVLVKPARGAENAAAALLRVLLKVSTRANELCMLVSALLNALRKYVCGSEEGTSLVNGPIWWTESLDSVYTSVMSLSPTQAAELLEAFSAELASFYTSPPANALTVHGRKPAKKKRRCDAGDVRTSAGADAIPDALCIVALLAPVLRSLKDRIVASATLLSVGSLAAQNEAAMKKFWIFIEKVLLRERRKRAAVPALILACALVDVADVLGGKEMVDGVLKLMGDVGEGGEADLWADFGMNLLRLRVSSSLEMSQHTESNVTCRDLLRNVLSDLLGKEWTAALGRIWDGRLESLTYNTLPVALWRSCVIERINLVNAYGTDEQLDGVLSILVESLVPDLASVVGSRVSGLRQEPGDTQPKKQRITIASCSRQLVMTSDFWEMRAIRDRFVTVCLREVQSLLRVSGMLLEGEHEPKKKRKMRKMETKNEKEGALIEAAFQLVRANVKASEFMATAGPLFVDVGALCREPAGNSATVVKNMAAATGFLASLPPHYLEKREISAVLAAALLVDNAVHRCADLLGRLKCAVACRTLAVNLARRRGDGGVMDLDSRLLAWMMRTCVVNARLIFNFAHDANMSAERKFLDRMVDLTSDLLKISVSKVVAEASTRDASELNLKDLAETWGCLASDDGLEFEAAQCARAQLEKVASLAVSGVRWRLLGAALGGVSAALEASRKRVRSSPCSPAVLADRLRKLHRLCRFQLRTIIEVLSKAGATDEFVEAATVRVRAFATLIKLDGITGKETAEREDGNDVELLVSLVELLLSRSSAKAGDSEISAESSSFVVSACISVLEILCEVVRKTSGGSEKDAHVDGVHEARGCSIPLFFRLLKRLAGMDWNSEAYRPLNAGVDALALTLLQSCPRNTYDEIVASVLEELFLESTTISPEPGCTDSFTISVYAFHMLIAKSSLGQKRSVRKHLPKVLARFCRATQIGCSKSAMMQIVQVVTRICADEAYDLSAWEVSSVLSVVSSFGTPECYLSTLKNGWTKTDAAVFFESACRVLGCISRHHPDAFMEIIPACTYVVRFLLHAFRSGGHTTLLSNRKLDCPDDIGHETTMRAKQTTEQLRPWRIIGDFAPLDVAQATSLSRVMIDMTSKHVAKPALRLSVTGTNPPGSGRHAAARPKDIVRAFSRHASRVLAEYFAIQSDPDPRQSIESVTLRAALRPGLYAVADLCADHDRELVMAELNAAGKALLKAFFADYRRDHKYTGKA